LYSLQSRYASNTFQIQKARGKNIGNISQKKKTAITTVKGMPKKKNTRPLAILPAYIWPRPGIMSESTAAKPEFLVPTVTLGDGVSRVVAVTFNGLPQ
jgi:hypothetical protein